MDLRTVVVALARWSGTNPRRDRPRARSRLDRLWAGMPQAPPPTGIGSMTEAKI
jgi:hypothetical protein